MVAAGEWTLPEADAPARIGSSWSGGERVFVILRSAPNEQTGNDLHRLAGTVAIGGFRHAGNSVEHPAERTADLNWSIAASTSVTSAPH